MELKQSMVEKAIVFATIAHQGQKRKGTGIPYILHPLEAGDIVSKMVFDQELISAAILHDVVEESAISYTLLASQFGQGVSDLVRAQSEDKDKSWKQRKQHTISTLPKETKSIKLVALGDKLSNIRAMHLDYLSIGDDLWQRFNVKDKREQEWYYRGLVDALAELAAYAAYAEFRCLVDKVFAR